MFKKLAAFSMKFRYPLAVLWILTAVIVFIVTPGLNRASGNDQAGFLPSDSDSVKASRMLNDLFSNKGGRSTAVIIAKREKGLSKEDRNYLKNLEAYFDKNRSSLQIDSILSPFANSEMEKELTSADGKAAMLSLSLSTPAYNDKTNDAVLEIKRVINDKGALGTDKPEGLKVAVTGDAVMSQEEKENIDRSMDLTVRLTIFLVLAILILVYRSPIAPLASLATIGASYSIARGIIAAMVEAGYKISSFTETFLIAVLFGAGTDYCLLLISRYREGLSAGKSEKDALADALPGTGAAILSSGGTVMVGFLFMAFAKFGLFNTTGPCVAIGVFITLLAVMSLLPSIISILGEKLFWPKHPSANGAKPHISEFWLKISDIVTRKPARFIIACVVTLLPLFIAAGFSSRSYDQLQELPSSSSSMQGFKMMRENFDQGKLMPVQIVMNTDRDLWTADSLQLIDRIAEDLAKVDNVEKVRTATRPLGDKITETSLPSQLKRLASGMDELGGGFDPIIKGLDDMKAGIDKISSGLKSGSSDMVKLADGTKATADGIGAAGDGLSELSNGASALASGLDRLAGSLDLLKNGIGGSSQSLSDITAALQGTQKLLEALGAQAPALAADANWQRAVGTLKQVLPGLEKISGGLAQSEQGLSAIKGGISESSLSLDKIKGGIDNANAGLEKIKASLLEIELGQRKAASGITKIPSALEDVSEGLGKSSGALGDMNDAFSSIIDAAGKYTGDSSADGENPLSNIFYLPPGALDEYPELKDAMENYISPSSKAVCFEVILSVPPYTKKALDTVKALRSAMEFSLKGTALEGSEFHLGGATEAFSEVRDVTSRDFMLVMTLVLLGILAVLVILLRSLVAPIYLILTIIFSYVTTYGISYLLFQVILGYDGLHWTVQFFSFCVLVALGVDYNIFLISRIKEEYIPGDVKGSVRRALAATGGIITSCGIIMSGTFAAMLASPIKPLFEIGFTASVGLLLDTFIIRSLLVPALAVKVGEMNWWPGRKIKVIPAETDRNSPKA